MEKLYRDILDICVKIKFQTSMNIQVYFYHIYDLYIDIDDKEIVRIHDFEDRKKTEKEMLKVLEMLKNIYQVRALAMANHICANDKCIKNSPDHSMNCEMTYFHTVNCPKRILGQ